MYQMVLYFETMLATPEFRLFWEAPARRASFAIVADGSRHDLGRALIKDDKGQR
jgi:hypothetical protein